MDLDRLSYMANQIARNFAAQGEAGFQREVADILPRRQGRGGQAGAAGQVAIELLANQLAQILAAVKLCFQLQALLQAMLVADRISQRQGSLQ